METTIQILKCHEKAAKEEISQFAECRTLKDGNYPKILVRSQLETDIMKVRQIEKKYNYSNGRKKTGIKDKNGVEILEYDILQNMQKEKCVVSIENCKIVIKYKTHSNFLATVNNFEVIGNVHQNPELLNENSRP